MSFLRRPERRAISYQDVWGRGDAWTGGSAAAGEQVTAASALGITAAWRCVSLLADTVASMPLHAYRDSNGSPKKVPSSPLVDSPSLLLTRREWTFQWMTSLLVWGNAYGLVHARDRLGYPTVIEWLDPASVDVTAESSLRAPRYAIGGKALPEGDVLHSRAFMKPGSLVGVSPLEQHRDTFGLALAVRRFGSEWFANGAHPSAVLETDQPVTQEQATTLKQRFKLAAKNREPVAMGAGLKYKPTQVSPNESQFLETDEAQTAKVAQVFGVPVEMIGGSAGGSSLTYANREQRSLDFLTFSVQPWLTRIEDALTGQLPRPQYVKFNAGALLRTDVLTRYEAHAVGISSGFLTVDEVRELEERPPLPKADPPAAPPQMEE